MDDLATPALVLDATAFEHNLTTMAAARPGALLRPHVKAHKCTGIARAQAAHGHRSFTCATAREMLGMAAAGLGEDLLLANETLDPARLVAMAAAAAEPGVRMTIAVDSTTTIEAAAASGIRDVLIDVNVGLPRCGCPPGEAGRLGQEARRRGLNVRGVMGYEGHLMMVPHREDRRAQVAAAVDLLLAAHADVGGDVVSAGGTGTYALHDRVTEVQGGSYALMDTQYATLELPFRPALAVLGTVISVNPEWAVLDVGLKALGMDHGSPMLEQATVWFCSDEHLTFAPTGGSPPPEPGQRRLVWPAHIDPTMSQHERVHVVENGRILDTWPIDLRGW